VIMLLVFSAGHEVVVNVWSDFLEGSKVLFSFANLSIILPELIVGYPAQG